VVAALIKVKAPRHISVGLMPMGTSNGESCSSEIRT
jgi:hypothetical protein